MARKVSGACVTMREQPSDGPVGIVRQREQAVAEIARRKTPALRADPARAPAVVRGRDDRRDLERAALSREGGESAKHVRDPVAAANDGHTHGDGGGFHCAASRSAYRRGL